MNYLIFLNIQQGVNNVSVHHAIKKCFLRIALQNSDNCYNFRCLFWRAAQLGGLPRELAQ